MGEQGNGTSRTNHSGRSEGMATGMTTVVLGHRPQRVAKGGRSEEVMADMEEGRAAAGEVKDVTMPKSATVSVTMTTIEIENETAALSTNE